MRNPIEVLKHLSEKSQDPAYKFQRIYRNLYNPNFYYLAYRNICANGGSMTKGVDGSNMDGMSEKRFMQVIARLQDQSYQPLPARRVYIEKKNSTKKRPLGIQAGNDKLVEEIVRMMLESIYEPTFSNSSHGFRQHKGCHTALTEIQRTFTGSVWFIEGDISACFDSFDHHVLIDLLSKRIDDAKFIALMWKFLKAGYMEQWAYHKTYSGTPQGSGMSPILANIYLSELDNYMVRYQADFRRGTKDRHRYTSQYTHLVNRNQWFKHKNEREWATLTKEEKKARAKTLRVMQNEKLRTPPTAFRNVERKSLTYVRYADDFIIGLIGSKTDALKLKTDLGVFLKETLHLTLSETKTAITHTTEPARFLGFDITVAHSQEIKRTKLGRRRVFNGKIQLKVPHDKWVSKLMEYQAIKIIQVSHKSDRWKPIHRGELINRTDIDILRKYNAEVRGLYNYYSIASNAAILSNFAYLMKRSMIKTFANKYRTHSKRVQERYCKSGIFTIQYTTKQGIQTSEYIHSFKRCTTPLPNWIDTLPVYQRYVRTNSLEKRLKAKVCQLCGKTGCDLEMHQVRQLKDLCKDSQWAMVMLDNHRKTLAVCHDCHEKIHACDKNDRLLVTGEPDTSRGVRPVLEGGRS